MTSCSGCGCTLGWKKYKFQTMWRIPGYYCKKCMIKLGDEFDRLGRLKSVAHPCGLCGSDFYFMKQAVRNGKQSRFCAVCHQAIKSGAVPANTPRKGPRTRPAPKQLPLAMMIFAGLGGLMMVLGLIFTMTATGEDANVLHILFGAATTAMGFMLIRKTLKSRSLIMGSRQPPPKRDRIGDLGR